MPTSVYINKYTISFVMSLLVVIIGYEIYKYPFSLDRAERAILKAAKQVLPDYTEGRAPGTALFSEGRCSFFFIRSNILTPENFQELDETGIAIHMNWLPTQERNYTWLTVVFIPPGYETRCHMDIRLKNNMTESERKDYCEKLLKGYVRDIVRRL